MNIVEQARQLGGAILTSPEYKSFQEAREAIESDGEAGKMLNILQEIRQALHEVRLAGGDVKEQADKLWTHQQKMMENKVISNYLDKKHAVQSLLDAVNKTIIEVTGLETGRPAGNCGSGSGGGCGKG